MKSKNRENSFRFARKSPVNAKSSADVIVAAYDVNSKTRDQEPMDEQPVGHGRRASMGEAELAMDRRLGESEYNMLVVQSNLADTYQQLGQLDRALRMRRIAYLGTLKLEGKESNETLREALNYTATLLVLKRFEEVKSLLRKTMPVAQRVLGENHDTTLKLRWNHAVALSNADGATLDDLREAVATLEEATRRVRRVYGCAHPTTQKIETDLKNTREAFRAREMS